MSVQAFHQFAATAPHPLVTQIDAVLMPRAKARLCSAIDASVACPSSEADAVAGQAIKAIIDLESLRNRFAGGAVSIQ